MPACRAACHPIHSASPQSLTCWSKAFRLKMFSVWLDTRTRGQRDCMTVATESGLTGILYQSDREYSEGFERDGGVGQGPAFEALAPHQR